MRMAGVGKKGAKYLTATMLPIALEQEENWVAFILQPWFRKSGGRTQWTISCLMFLEFRRQILPVGGMLGKGCALKTSTLGSRAHLTHRNVSSGGKAAQILAQSLVEHLSPRRRRSNGSEIKAAQILPWLVQKCPGSICNLRCVLRCFRDFGSWKVLTWLS